MTMPALASRRSLSSAPIRTEWPLSDLGLFGGGFILLASMLIGAYTPTKTEDRLKADAAYRLAEDAWHRAEVEYRTALAALSTDELVALAG